MKDSKSFAVLSFIVIILFLLCGLAMIGMAMPVIGTVVSLP